MTRFDRDTAVKAAGDGAFDARIDDGWWITRGPNGGYVAAILMRALAEARGDPLRHARSLTVHYTSPPVEGPVRIETRIEREGRSMSTISARMFQQDKLRAFAVSALSRERKSDDVQDTSMPEVPPPERVERAEQSDSPATLRARYETRPLRLEAARYQSGGWIRLAEPRVADAPVIAAYADSFPPAAMLKHPGWRGAPTVDLTVHFRSALPLARSEASDYFLALFRTRTIREGFMEEDGEIWSRDGTLIAQSRQLAVFL